MNKLERKVEEIINNVKLSGDTAVVKYTKLFDGIKNFTKRDIKLKILRPPYINDKNFIESLQTAIFNIKKFHIEEYKNLRKSWKTKYNGIETGQKFIPVESAGIYIPGGKYGFNYISTLLMTVIPAQVAKVKNIVVVTPPKNVTDYFIYTAYKLGIKEIYKIGGAQAIAALAFGTETIPKVDIIVGPGNVWVTEAKRQLVGVVGIDLLAGPSEVVVVGDSSYSVEEIVFELLAQAEHDKEAKSYFIGVDKEIVDKVKTYITKNVPEFMPQIKILLEKNINNICDIINKIAPEHLTLLTKNQN
ncbi:MAG: histidinol dehydrogenase, partial [Endomicrobia bacterium]|nr:histidinol dehydrogenase [Endomicrobiia bacterium]